MALCLIRQTRFEDGIACLTSLLHYAPDNLRAHYLRGKAFKSINEYQIALWDFDKALSLVQIGQFVETERSLRQLKEEAERLLETQRVEEVMISKKPHCERISDDSDSNSSSLERMIQFMENNTSDN